MVQFDPDEQILTEGEEPKYLYYLFDGRAKVLYPQKNGKISLVAFLTAPSFIGELEFLQAQKAASSVQALTVCRCFRIFISACRSQLLDDRKFLRNLSTLLARAAVANTYNYSRNQTCTLNVRLAEFILLTATKSYYRERHTETAEFLGVTYRHLLYVLADFVQKGYLEKTQQGYRILDAAALRRLAGQKE